MAVTAQQVKQLRDETGLPMMQCKHALVETDGDIEKALDYLRKQGAKTAEKRAHRETLDGAIGMYVHHDGKLGVMVELNCETTPVAKTEAFRELRRAVLRGERGPRFQRIFLQAFGVPQDLDADMVEFFEQYLHLTFQPATAPPAQAPPSMSTNKTHPANHLVIGSNMPAPLILTRRALS